MEPTEENIRKIQGEILEWSQDQCRYALQVLVERDMNNLGGLRSLLEDARGGVTVSCDGEKLHMDMAEEFRKIVVFAIYNIRCFRVQIKARLKSLGLDANLELKKVIRHYFGENETQKQPPCLFFGIPVTY